MSKVKAIKEEAEWDKYWTKKKTKSQNVYRGIASFYRTFIIKRSLNFFLQKEFKAGAKLLHAGSGSGKVDEDLVKNFDITALDISNEALKLYRLNNGINAKTLKASIFAIPVANGAFDGIYNLGVHEHFTGAENEKIFKEYLRVLKKDGKIVLFWPPKYSLSVNFLNSTHFILNDVLRRNIRLHPEEISLIQSEKQVRNFLRDCGFKITAFYFGPKDLFTQCVIVAKKIKG
jgi:SAM-dependent methyltransferase